MDIFVVVLAVAETVSIFSLRAVRDLRRMMAQIFDEGKSIEKPE